MNAEPVEFPATKCTAETAAACHLIINGKGYWIPKSQIHDDSEVFNAKNDNYGTLVLTEWIAIQKGLV